MPFKLTLSQLTKLQHDTDPNIKIMADAVIFYKKNKNTKNKNIAWATFMKLPEVVRKKIEKMEKK